MAVQSIVTIIVLDPYNPVEVQDWFTAHPLALINSICVVNSIFYITYA